MKKEKTKIILTVLALTIISGFLRFYKITQNPPSLTGDEISFGYSAYSILKTGRDEHGKFLPLTFESVGDFKNPVPAYLMIPSIAIFGLTDFAVRFPNALMATLTIPVFYFFLLDIFKKKNIAFLGGLFLAISGWHIFYSRFAYEATTASLFILLGTWFFVKILEDRKKFIIPSAFFFLLTMYTSFAPRMFTPVFVATLIAVNYHCFKNNKKTILVFLFSCFIFAIPLIYTTFFQGAGTRMRMVFISNDIEFSRYVILKNFNSITDALMLFFFWIKRYLSYFDPSFLFFNGLEATIPGPIGLGIYYIFEIPFVILGIKKFIKDKIPYKKIFVVWTFVGILPDSLTNNQKHTGRLLHLFPVLILFSVLGAIELLNIFKKISDNYKKVAVISIFAAIIFINLVHAYLIYTTVFPADKGESFDEGWRETVYWVKDHQGDYKEIVFDPRRGVAAPDIISNPFLYVLFYTKYDPAIYQSEKKFTGIPGEKVYYYKFGKYTFRNINWTEDRDDTGTLFVGSPWSFPKEGMRKGELLHTIYLSSGCPGFYIVTPKPDRLK